MSKSAWIFSAAVLPAAVALGAIALAVTPASAARKWTSSDGKFSVEAELVGVADGKVTLKKATGATATVPLTKLSAADRQFVASFGAKKVSYARDIKPFIAKCCVECHRQKKARGGYRLETYADLVKVGKKGATVIPGNSAKSRAVVTHVAGKAHPPKDKAEKDDRHVKAPKPTAEEMDRLIAWIDAGAVNDSAPSPPRGSAKN